LQKGVKRNRSARAPDEVERPAISTATGFNPPTL
jgi:hypothetical protein